MTEIQNTMALFGVTQEDLNQIVSAALSRGGDYADLYFELSTANEVSMEKLMPQALISITEWVSGYFRMTGPVMHIQR